jgi:hypothetical protein
MATNTFASEDSWETKAFWHKLLRYAHIFFRFRLTDDKFSNL